MQRDDTFSQRKKATKRVEKRSVGKNLKSGVRNPMQNDHLSQ